MVFILDNYSLFHVITVLLFIINFCRFYFEMVVSRMIAEEDNFDEIRQDKSVCGG